MEAAEEKCFFFFQRQLLQVFSQSKGAEVVARVRSQPSTVSDSRKRQFVRLRYEDACFTFFSLGGNKDPDLSSLICVSVRVVGSTEFSTPTSFTVHFWNT